MIKKAEKITIIPRQANAIFPGLQDIYKPYYHTRSAIERFFSQINDNKWLALRLDKLIHTITRRKVWQFCSMIKFV